MCKKFGIPQYEDDTSDISNSLLKAIAKYKKLQCVNIIKNTFKSLSTLSFHHDDESDFKKEIVNLNNSKAFEDSDISAKIINNNLDPFKKVLC